MIVPVLPQQISSTLPQYSGAARFLTRILSLYILLTENAKATSIVIGRPSGMEATSSTTIKTIMPESFEKMIVPSGRALASSSDLVLNWMVIAIIRQSKMKRAL